MEITNTKYIWCPRCGTEARGFDEINEKFGYRIKNRKEIVAYQKCKACRGEQEEKMSSNGKENKFDWSQKQYTVTRWAREIHMKAAKFKNYLYELGYLEKEPNSYDKNMVDQLTDKGKEHTHIRKFMGRKIILWDFDAFADVLKRDVDSSVALLKCPKCKKTLGELSNEHPEFDDMEKCQYCGFTGKERLLELAKR